MDWVAKGSGVVGHFGIATQYMLLILWAACVGPAGPGCKLPSGWLVLICEEGIVPPINTNSSDKRFRQNNRQQKNNKGGKKKVAAYFAVPGKVDLECLGVVLEAKGSHGKENILAIDRLALLLLTLFGGCGMGSVG